MSWPNSVIRPFLVAGALALPLFLAGCAIGPDYQRPDIAPPAAWRTQQASLATVADTDWWDQFSDPALSALIRDALKESKDLRIAAARVEEYLGRYGATRADQFPQASAGGTAGRQRITEKGYSPLPSSIDPTFYNFQGTLNTSWELDIWGKYRRATEAARADLVTTEEGRRSVVLSLVTSVASGYVNLLSLDRQLDIAQQTAKTWEESYRLFQLRFSGGVISELELNQVKSQYEETLAYIPQLEKAILQQENALNLLVGRNPGPIRRGRKLDSLSLPAVPSGLPSELLERRPDIRQAEQELISANARIGVAKAAYFPSISLTGYFGNSSVELRDLFTGPSRIWSWGGAISMPIFTAGRIRGQVHAAKAVQEQALLRYAKTIQTAFREVEDNLADLQKTGERLVTQTKQVKTLRSYRDLATLRYDNGYSSYLEVLDAERNLFSAELAHAQSTGGRFLALVNLYKAMGGGWVQKADAMAATTSAEAKKTATKKE